MAGRPRRRRARRSQGRLGWRGMVATYLVGMPLSGLAGALAYVLPVLTAGCPQTGRAAHASPASPCAAQ